MERRQSLLRTGRRIENVSIMFGIVQTKISINFCVTQPYRDTLYPSYYPTWGPDVLPVLVLPVVC